MVVNCSACSPKRIGEHLATPHPFPPLPKDTFGRKSLRRFYLQKLEREALVQGFPSQLYVGLKCLSGSLLMASFSFDTQKNPEEATSEGKIQQEHNMLPLQEVSKIF